MSHRRAFGLTELLVVIAIIAILIALRMLAGQRVRHAATRTQTMNNMRHSGAAMKVKDAKTRIVSLKIRNITDGTSNTIMTSTRMSSCDRTPKGEPVPTLINGDPGTPSGGFFGATAVKDAPSPLYAATPLI